MKCCNGRSIYRNYFLVLFLLLFQLFFNPCFVFADRQSELESLFDIVYTFDNCQDWIGNCSAGDCKDQSGMPKYIDGSPTHWGFYANYKEVTPDNWIGDHGTEYNWKGSTKSLCINYNRIPTKAGIPTGYGPSTLSMYFGDGTPSSGYKKMYVFFMMKFRPGFFTVLDDTIYRNTGVIKFIDMIAGFRSVSAWGTVEEAAGLCDGAQLSEGYGLNFNIWNFTNFDRYTNLGFQEQQNVTDDSYSCYTYKHLYASHPAYNAYFEPEYRAGKWFGVELMTDIGTEGNADGSHSITIYNEAGIQIGYSAKVNENKLLVHATHKYNKITFGGNRIGYSYSEDASDSDENRLYVDDFIVDNEPVAVKYFSLLSGVVSSPPTDPGKISIEK